MLRDYDYDTIARAAQKKQDEEAEERIDEGRYLNYMQTIEANHKAERAYDEKFMSEHESIKKIVAMRAEINKENEDKGLESVTLSLHEAGNGLISFLCSTSVDHNVGWKMRKSTRQPPSKTLCKLERRPLLSS